MMCAAIRHRAPVQPLDHGEQTARPMADPSTDRQMRIIALRFGLPLALARAIASLAFGEGRA